MSEEYIGSNRDRPLQKRKRDRRGITAAKRRKFLDTLAGNCNVSRSAEAAKVDKASLYRLRRREPAFAEQWQEALAIGYARLEEAILIYSLKSVQATDAEPVCDTTGGEAEKIATASPGEISSEAIKLAMDVIAKHRSAVNGAAFVKRGRRRATTEETDAALRRKLDALARKVKGQAG